MKIVIDVDKYVNAVFGKKYSPVAVWAITTIAMLVTFCSVYFSGAGHYTANSVFYMFLLLTQIFHISSLGLIGMVIGYNLKNPYRGLIVGSLIGAIMTVLYVFVLMANPFSILAILTL